jgi:hypothetical protein
LVRITHMPGIPPDRAALTLHTRTLGRWRLLCPSGYEDLSEAARAWCRRHSRVAG